MANLSALLSAKQKQLLKNNHIKGYKIKQNHLKFVSKQSYFRRDTVTVHHCFSGRALDMHLPTSSYTVHDRNF